ncbi:MAG: hypothetical protein GX238_11675 [Epulopiscium sp.]|nr:hypothetical protein [Candidatus Epulonipiscium sp.]
MKKKKYLFLIGLGILLISICIGVFFIPLIKDKKEVRKQLNYWTDQKEVTETGFFSIKSSIAIWELIKKEEQTQVDFEFQRDDFSIEGIYRREKENHWLSFDSSHKIGVSLPIFSQETQGISLYRIWNEGLLNGLEHTNFWFEGEMSCFEGDISTETLMKLREYLIEQGIKEKEEGLFLRLVQGYLIDQKQLADQKNIEKIIESNFLEKHLRKYFQKGKVSMQYEPYEWLEIIISLELADESFIWKQRISNAAMDIDFIPLPEYFIPIEEYLLFR